MGVYIEGMEMPKDQPQLLWVYPNGKAMTVQSDVDPWKELQAVPVPPHGRLGDLDELYASLKKWLIRNRNSMTAATRAWIRGVLEGIAAAPTIIPAEEGE